MFPNLVARQQNGCRLYIGGVSHEKAHIPSMVEVGPDPDIGPETRSGSRS